MAAVLLLAALAAPADMAPLPSSVHDAVVAAVRARVGAGAEVEVEAIEAVLPLRGDVADAVLMPGARVGATTGVVLRGRRGGPGAEFVTVGRVNVRVRVTVPHAHTTRPIARGSRLAEADLAVTRHALPSGALRALPGAEALVDGRVLRDLPEDACLTPQVVAASPAVVAGQEVAAVVREGRVEVRATLVAVDSGAVGEMVRVAHPGSRRTRRARVIGRAEVEIRHEP
jgi:flagella basal body P-ring formation protein FlgA